MAFLFGYRNNEKKIITQTTEQLASLDKLDIDSYQPNNPFKDLTILPYFKNSIEQVCITNDKKRIIVGESCGNLTFFDANTGNKLASISFHKSSINGIINYNNVKLASRDCPVSDLIIVSSSDKSLSAWDLNDYKLINSIKSSLNANKIFLNFYNYATNRNHPYFIVAGTDLKLFDVNLFLIDEHKRKSDSIKLMASIDDFKFALSTNYDIEIFELINLNENEYKIKELRKYKHSHKETILCLSKISNNVFASGSSDGHLILWQSDSLIKLIDIPPSEYDVNLQSISLSTNSVSCLKPFNDRYVLVCFGSSINIFDNSSREFINKVFNAHHGSRITDLLVLNSQFVVSSAENGSIRIWKFLDLTDFKTENKESIPAKLVLFGECLGHSASILSIKTITMNEILSISNDNMIIIWRLNLNSVDL